MIARVVLALIWALHFLPLAVLACLGEGIGLLGYWLVGSRRQVCLINLQKCFPELTVDQRRRLARKHFRLFGRFVLEHGIMWWGSEARLKRTVQMEDEHHLRDALGSPLILLAPHFLGLDMGGVRISCETAVASMYQKQKDAVFDERIRSGRLRFGRGLVQLFSRQDGVRGVARAVKQAIPFYYLPDMDFGPRETIFVPFFGVPTATITGVSRLARLGGARVVPCVTRMLPGGAGYRLKFYPPIEGFPSDDIVADTRRINAFIEDRVRELPEQYYWVHKRFKTRPPGEAAFY